jgi:membrane protein implicated in regulation of membrane protease activity
VLSTIGLVVNVISLITASMLPMAAALVGIAINAIILYYLSRRNVRQYFGNKAGVRESSSSTTTVGI